MLVLSSFLLYFGSVAACVLRVPIILGSTLFEDFLMTLYRSAMYFILMMLLYIKRSESLFRVVLHKLHIQPCHYHTNVDRSLN